MSPSKQRLYKAHESLDDAAKSWLTDHDMARLAAALGVAAREARLVVATYLDHASGRYVDKAQAQDSREKAAHVDRWAAELEAVRKEVEASKSIAAIVDHLGGVLDRVTIYDNWWFEPVYETQL